MAYLSKPFQTLAAPDLQSAIDAFLASAPAKTPVSVGFSATPAGYAALLIYQQ